MSYIMDLRKAVGSIPLIMVGSCIFVVREDLILLQKRTDNGMWGLPGGGMEPGETTEEVAARELYEETGLKAIKLQLFDVFSGPEFYYQYPNGDEVNNVAIAYICNEFAGELITDGDEVSDIRFFRRSELPENISPPDRPILKAFLQRG